jgi:hypothetical protein
MLPLLKTSTMFFGEKQVPPAVTVGGTTLDSMLAPRGTVGVDAGFTSDNLGVVAVGPGGAGAGVVGDDVGVVVGDIGVGLDGVRESGTVGATGQGVECTAGVGFGGTCGGMVGGGEVGIEIIGDSAGSGVGATELQAELEQMELPMPTLTIIRSGLPSFTLEHASMTTSPYVNVPLPGRRPARRSDPPPTFSVRVTASPSSPVSTLKPLARLYIKNNVLLMLIRTVVDLS